MPTPDAQQIADLLNRMADSNLLEEAIAANVGILQSDMQERVERIKAETPYSKAYVGKRKRGSKQVVTQGVNFGRDTGKLQDGWLGSIEIKGFEISFHSDYDYAIAQQDLTAQKSPFADGYLGLSDVAIALFFEEIGKSFEKLWQS